MKSPYLKGGAALAAVALAVIGTQAAMGDESGPDTAKGAHGPREAAASAWDVSYASESLEATLTDVAAVSADEGWAVGQSQTDGGKAQGVLLHRTGGKWKDTGLPEGAGAGAMPTEVEASGPDNVWLFGNKRVDGEATAFAYRWDGAKWTSVPAPPASGVGSFPTQGAAVAGPDDVWTVDADNAAHHWDGTKWSDVTLPARAQSLAALGPDDVWAVGFRDTSGEPGPMSQPAAMHWDGTAWKLEETPEYHFPDPAPPEESASLGSVVAVSENEVWAVGSHTFNHGEGGPEPAEENILLRWDGKEWQKAAADATAKASPQAAPDGAGGAVLSRSWHLAEDGALQEIAKHEPVPGRSGEVTDVDKKQKFYPEKTVPVPGGKQVWSVGVIELGAQGDANFRRGAVLSYDVP